MNQFKIFPSIGIARLGGSTTHFYLCPEKEGSLGIEIDNMGNEKELLKFKDDMQLIKRQGARFRVFSLDATNGDYTPVDMNSVTVEWTVHLVNKKAAVLRNETPDRPIIPFINPPSLPLATKPNADALIIDPGIRKISGQNKSDVKFDTGKFKTEPIFIGELKTDKEGNLIVLGGHGKSKSVQPQGQLSSPITDFYFSENWCDDTADGFVKATLKLSDGTIKDVVSAWVITAPPDFAPDVKGLVTLYDVMQQVAIDFGAAEPPIVPSFKNHVLPIINRFKNLRWVHGKDDPTSIFNSINDLDSVLADNSNISKNIRMTAKMNIEKIKFTLEGREKPSIGFQMTALQLEILDKWANGNFISDLNTESLSSLNKADSLSKLVLDSTVGQGFYPGIEGGIIVKKTEIYKEPFRFDDTIVNPGDITGLMALPWQADFFDCAQSWWPSQRPDDVKLAGGTFASWDDNIGNALDLINNFNKLGFVKPEGPEQIESERSLPR